MKELREFVEYLLTLDPEQRLDVLAEIKETICIHCGDKLSKNKKCYCSKEE